MDNSKALKILENIRKVIIGKDDEIEILKKYGTIKNFHLIEPVVSKEDILNMQSTVDSLTVHNDIMEYIVNIVNATRTCEELLVENLAFQDKNRISTVRDFKEGDSVKSIHWKLKV